MKTFETNRLILRDWDESDIGCEVHDEERIRYLLAVKNNYAVVLKENWKVIGSIGISEDAAGDPNVRNVGLFLLEEYRNKGLISEALSCIFNHADDTAEFSWFCPVDQTLSRHLAEKFGCWYVKTFYGVQRKPTYTPKDYCYYQKSISKQGANQ